MKNLFNLVNPHRVPFFYGWIVVVFATLGIVASIPGQTAGVAVFTDYLIDAYRLDRGRLSMAYLLGTVGSSFLLPFAGRLLDRIGASLMIMIAGLGLSSSLTFLALAPQGLKYIGVDEDTGFILPFFTVTLAFLGIRHFGQGQMTMVSRTVMSRWFKSHIGTVNGFSGIVVAFTFGLAPSVLNGVIFNLGWINGMLSLIFVSFSIGLLCSIFFFDSPSACGVAELPTRKGAHHSGQANQEMEDWTLEAVKKSPDFWLFNWSLVMQGLIITGFTFHFSGIARDVGLASEKAFAVFLPMACISTVGNLIGGFLTRRISIYWHLVTLQVCLGAGSFSTVYMETTMGFYSVAFFFGLSGGMFACLSVVCWPHFFGTLHLGKISGYHLGWVVFGSAVGPYLMSVVSDVTFSLANAAAWLAIGPLLCFLVTIYFQLKRSVETSKSL